MLKHSVGSPICKNCCGSSTDKVSATRLGLLRTENAFIKEEIRRVTHIMGKYGGPGVLSCPLHATGSSAGASDNKGNGSVYAAQDGSPSGEVLECNE